MAEIKVSNAVLPRTGQRVVEISDGDGLQLSMTPAGARELAAWLVEEAAVAECLEDIEDVLERRKHGRTETLAVLHELRERLGERRKT